MWRKIMKYIIYFLIVFQLLPNHPYWTSVIIATGAIAASEVIWYVYNRIYKWMKSPKAQVHEVLMFNELRYDCIQEHRKSNETRTEYRCHNQYCYQRNVDRMIEQLDKAKYSIDLAMYHLYSREMMKALQRALRRKVVVRVIYHRLREPYLPSHLADLIYQGAHLLTHNSSNFFHHKFCVIDGPGRVDYIWSQKKHKKKRPEPTDSVLLNGSLNWSDGGLGANWENVVITSHAKIVEEFQSEFNRLWKVFSLRVSQRYVENGYLQYN